MANDSSISCLLGTFLVGLPSRAKSNQSDSYWGNRLASLSFSRLIFGGPTIQPCARTGSRPQAHVPTAAHVPAAPEPPKHGKLSASASPLAEMQGILLCGAKTASTLCATKNHAADNQMSAGHSRVILGTLDRSGLQNAVRVDCPLHVDGSSNFQADALVILDSGGGVDRQRAPH